MGTGADLDRLFASLQGHGTYRLTVVSNQPDGVAGFCGRLPGNLTLNARLSGPGELTAASDGSPGAREPVTVSVRSTGAGQYLVVLNFTGEINRRFEIPCQCVGEAIVGCSNAIGANEYADHVTHVVIVGPFSSDPR
ncbi:hypothetical protein [Amycolatopsis sp. NPDC051371]|uniref:hypothetical protein n=1 Tax=Amycolatopsis sp. NPDC051371 TaxID=3155800 RepID=UPI0034157A85